MEALAGPCPIRQVRRALPSKPHPPKFSPLILTPSISLMARACADIWLLSTRMHGDRRLDHACLLPRARMSGPVPASSMLGSTESTSMLPARLSAPLDHLHSLEASQASFYGGWCLAGLEINAINTLQTRRRAEGTNHVLDVQLPTQIKTIHCSSRSFSDAMHVRNP